MRKALIENMNALAVLAGFAAIMTGVTSLWSWAAAAIVGGSVLLFGGVWPYVIVTVRKQGR